MSSPLRFTPQVSEVSEVRERSGVVFPSDHMNSRVCSLSGVHRMMLTRWVQRPSNLLLPPFAQVAKALALCCLLCAVSQTQSFIPTPRCASRGGSDPFSCRRSRLTSAAATPGVDVGGRGASAPQWATGWRSRCLDRWGVGSLPGEVQPCGQGLGLLVGSAGCGTHVPQHTLFVYTDSDTRAPTTAGATYTACHFPSPCGGLSCCSSAAG